MPGSFRINEIKPVSIEGGYLIDGFPSVGFTSAIATESLIRTTQFELVGFLDSDRFPAVSMIRGGKPHFPTSIHANDELNVAVFSSYLALDRPSHKRMARTMLEWAEKHGVKYVISSVAVKSASAGKITAAASTEEAEERLKECGVDVLQRGAIPGIPGALLNQGMIKGQNVIVILFNSTEAGPDFKSGADLCTAFSKIVPGVSCDIPALQKEAEKIEEVMKEAKEETKHLSEGMYR